MLIIWNKKNIKQLSIICLLLILLYLFVCSFGTIRNFSVRRSHRKTSLIFKDQMFYLKDELFYIYSGSIHYFRVPLDMWKQRLRFLKSAGLNTVDTYIPWNLHEEVKGNYNFEGNLNVRKFIQIAHELGLYVILRPGPYICAEIEFGGMPSWLLTDPNMKVRSMYIGFLNPAEEYIKQLLREINDLQHSNGGPIIAFQLENEYGAYGASRTYLQAIKDIFIRAGVVEALFQSNDNDGFSNHARIEDTFIGINSNSMESIEDMVSTVRSIEPENPVFISELWTGWFHNWGSLNNQNVISDEDFKSLINVLLKKGYSFNLYMFHGGTNFGFINGGSNISNVLHVTTSYDYGAPISEDGRPNNKFFILRKALINHQVNDKNYHIYDMPKIDSLANYGDVELTQSLDLNSILELVDNAKLKEYPVPMEELPINAQSGQSFGFIVYRTSVNKSFKLLKVFGKIQDRGILFYNNKPITGNWKTSILGNNRDIIILGNSTPINKDLNFGKYLDIMVENLGRINFANFQSSLFSDQRKGIIGKISIDSNLVKNWKIYPLELKKSFMNKISGSPNWKDIVLMKSDTPKMYKGLFILNEKPTNTYVSVSTWTKGVVFVNGFNLGRYWNIGPTQTLFLPKSFLRIGENEIIIFELHTPGNNVRLQSNPVFLLTPSPNFV